MQAGDTVKREAVPLPIDIFFWQQRGFYSHCITVRASKPIKVPVCLSFYSALQLACPRKTACSECTLKLGQHVCKAEVRHHHFIAHRHQDQRRNRGHDGVSIPPRCILIHDSQSTAISTVGFTQTCHTKRDRVEESANCWLLRSE